MVFVGDSRTHAMGLTMNSEFDRRTMKNAEFVAKSGADLNWFRKTGYRQLMKVVNANKSGKPLAIVFNFGVNDLKHGVGDVSFDVDGQAKRYIRYFTQIAAQLKAKNCQLYYMSVNPINSSMLPKKGNRTESEIFRFNWLLKRGLAADYKYIDTNTYLLKNGYTTGRISTDEVDDGIHYQRRTYKRIYSYCIRKINAA